MRINKLDYIFVSSNLSKKYFFSKFKSYKISNNPKIINTGYLKLDHLIKNFKSIPKNLNLLTITLEEAVELLSTKKTSSSILKSLGQDEQKNNIVIKDGRYGTFITNGKVNAPMPKGVSEDELNLDEAIKILSTRKPRKFKKRK